MAKSLTGEQVLEMQSKGLNIQEIQTLASQNGYSMPDNRNFTQKVAPILDMIFGGGKIGEAIGAQIAKTQVSPENRQFVETPSAGEVAGSALQSVALFTPVGRLAGGITGLAAKTGLKTGVSAVGKIGSGAIAGGAFDVAQELQGRDSGGLGTAIGAAIPAVGVGLNVAGRVAKTVAPKLLSYTSDVPEKAFETMLQRREPVVSAIKAGATPQTALKNTQGAVRQLRTTLSNDWQEGVNAIQQEFTGKRLGLSSKSEASLLKIADEFGFEDKLPQNLKNASVNEWMDTLKAINGLPKLMLSMSPKGAQLRELKKALEGSVIKTFGGEKGSVAQLYKNYSAKKGVLDAANDIVNAYSIGKPIQQSTALNRLQTLFNENKPAYLEAILDLEKTTGRDLLSEITASKFANKLPTMGSSVSATSGILAPTGILDKAIKLLLLPLSSPRSAGFIARATQKVRSPGLPTGTSPGDRLLQTQVGQKLEAGVKDYVKNPKLGLSMEDVSKKNLNESRIQEIKNHIQEGQNLLRAGINKLGEPLTSGERFSIRKSIQNAQDKLGEGLKLNKSYSIEDVTPVGYGPEASATTNLSSSISRAKASGQSGETITLYRAAPKFPSDKFDIGTYFADDAGKAKYYSESHYKGNPSDIKVEQFTLPKSAVFKEPSTGNYILKGEAPVQRAVANDLTLSIKSAKQSGQSFDEWVKGQGQVFRVSEDVFTPTKVGEAGVFVSRSETIAKSFGEGGKRPLQELSISPNARILKFDDLPQNLKSFEGKDIEAVHKQIADYARKNNFDAVESIGIDKATSIEIQVVNPKVLKTRSQLKAEWDKIK